MKKIVKIGKYYAIRKWSLFYLGYQYKDLEHGFWWSKEDRFFDSCLAKTKEELYKYPFMYKDEVIETFI